MKYTIGADFGTLSVRTVLASVSDGRIVASAESVYPHGVMSTALPDGTPLPPDYALQHPDDYMDGLKNAVRALIDQSAADPADVIALALDCTADTCLPVDADGTPLCLLPAFGSCAHAWIKLWKHHGAEQEARDIREAALADGGELLIPYGGQVSSEWMLPKLLETCRKAPQVIEAADRFLQVGDWIVNCLTGSTARSASHAGFKNFYTDKGYPSDDFLVKLHPLLSRFHCLNRGELLPPGALAGCLHERGAALLGLRPGTAVAVSGTDAFHPMPALGLIGAGDLLMSIGTSTCHTLLSAEYRPYAGLCGAVRDGIVPGLYGYECGQSCTGDLFDWAVKHLQPDEKDMQEAQTRGIGMHQLLTEQAARLQPGESGLIALDWWNGCRSPFMNAHLTGMLMGMTLSTTTAEVYRALIEANAFATRLIVESYQSHGLPVKRVFACGGISRKNPLLMQIYADVLGMELRVADATEAASLGSAIFAAAAAGRARGGYDTLSDACAAMKCKASTVYTPNAENKAAYDCLYREYIRLTELFAGKQDSVMAKLKEIRMH